MNKVFFLISIVSVAAADSGNYPSGNDPYKVYKNNPSYNMQNTYSNSRYTEQYESYAPQPYEFGYEVNDGYQSDFGHQETGNGKGSVSGSYHVKLPDGRNQLVTYKDDGYGFVADVQYEGLAQFPVNKQTGYSNQNYGDSDPYSNPIYRSEISSHNPQLHHKATRPYSSSVQY